MKPSTVIVLMRSFLVLIFLLALSGSGLSRPQIDSMMVDETRDQLLIYGDFSSAAGSVTIDGHPQKIIRWMTEWIRCELPRVGPGSSGPVLVTDDEGYLSEPRKISEMGFDLLIEWRPTHSTNPEILHYEGRTHHLRIRADVESRLRRDAIPVIPFEITGYSSSLVNCQQGFFSRSYGSSISSGGSIDWADTNSTQGVRGSGVIDLLTSSIKLKLRVASHWPVYYASWYVSGMYHDQYDRTYDTSMVEFAEKLDLELALDKDLAIRSVYEKQVASQIRSIVGVQYQVDSIFMLTPRVTMHPPSFTSPSDYKLAALPTVIDFGVVKVGDTAIKKFAAHIEGAHYWEGPYQSHVAVSFDSAFSVLNSPPLYYSTIVPALDSMVFCFIPRDTLPADAFIVVTAGSPNDGISPAHITVRGNFPKAKVRNERVQRASRVVAEAEGYAIQFDEPYSGTIEIRNSIGQLVKILDVESSNIVPISSLRSGWYQVLASGKRPLSLVIQ